MLNFKFRHFGHDMVVLHSREIRKATGQFAFLVNPALRTPFLTELSAIITNANFTLIAAIIDKRRLVSTYRYPDNPYELALLFCLERTYAFLKGIGQEKLRTHIIVEARGKKEDQQLELEFRRICAGSNHWGVLPFEIHFASKAANSSGLQLADLVGRPIGQNHLQPAPASQAYAVIDTKFRRSPGGTLSGWGRKTFP